MSDTPLPQWRDGAPLPASHLAWGPSSGAEGLLAWGGSLSLKRLEQAYRRGVFPWYSQDQPVLWWAPDPRMLLPVAAFKLQPSLRKTLKKFIATPGCEVRIDSAFPAVLAACAQAPREGQAGTWILPPMQAAYTRWHRAGTVHSFETWIGGELVGGLYGVGIGRMFYGESMFMRRSDASKIALAALVCFCREHGITVIDCQQNTRHLASLGAQEVPRSVFEDHLAKAVVQAAVPAWTYHENLWRHIGLAPAPTDARP